ncbi:Phosphoglucosamine mutase [Candidatus Jidaibacter acanthamoeba]|uniref:Phosphoglucosamine mutase n=1 Tax=Candidatus Jidaibacter acanthamoebae TaxID=86105 RepID=A0A0C1QG75_9RICK|nr:phosphoglucosamine mutase [Candidatus Jidaibacter acanthamoeba]KIE04554.1 Phosphoglucosamine mutase [Candidatus Jidaibacter acanthamoeba]
MQRLFGTDGIRGTANQYPMTAEIAMKFGMAAGTYYKKLGHRNRVVIAKDTRLSGYLIEPALTSGFISVGVDVILVGPMPTPAVSMLIRSLRADLGVMISASHNPYFDNGLKLFDSKGFKLSDECEDKIQEMILSADINRYLVPPIDLGRAKRLDDAPGRYIEHVKNSFNKENNLTGLRIVVDGANGSAYHLAPTILWELGAEVISIGTEPNGFNINEACGSTHPETLSKKVVETRADIGIALDGDADRVVIVDDKGHIISGDHVIGLIALHLHNRKRLNNDMVVVTQMSNGALDEYLKSHNINTIRTKVGDRYVFDAMRKNNCNLGGEQSGHVILSNYSTTGDGIVAALQVLSLLVESGKKMSKLSHIFELYPQVVRNIKFTKNNPLENPKLQEELEEINKSYNAERIFIRKSGTEKLVRVMVEGKQKNIITEAAQTIETLISEYCS